MLLLFGMPEFFHFGDGGGTLDPHLQSACVGTMQEALALAGGDIESPRFKEEDDRFRSALRLSLGSALLACHGQRSSCVLFGHFGPFVGVPFFG
jgi:hypothetical protein